MPQKNRFRYRSWVLSLVCVVPVSGVVASLAMQSSAVPVNVNLLVSLGIGFELVILVSTTIVWFVFRDKLRAHGWEW